MISNKIDKLELISPPGAQTNSSIAIVWNKVNYRNEFIHYQVYLNEQLWGFSKHTDFTFTNLDSDKIYSISVTAISEKGFIIGESDLIKVSTKSNSHVLNIRDFDATEGTEYLNTHSIQEAINKCPFNGVVKVPAGVFRTGAIFLKSNMTIFLEEGATILGSEDTADYPLITYRWEGRDTLCYSSLINTIDDNELENISIIGKGKIDANGSILRRKELQEAKGAPGRAVCLRSVKNLYMYGVTVKHSPAWCVHLIYCSNVTVNQVTVLSKKDELGNKYQNIINGDGLNLDSCKNVWIFNCTIGSQDDCIAIKSGRDLEGRQVGVPTENVWITNCKFISGFGVAVGSEMSGSVRNVLVEDSIFKDVYSVISIKPPRGRGGLVENISVNNCVMENRSEEYQDCEWFRGAIYMDMFYSHKQFDVNEYKPRNEGTPVVRNIKIANVIVDTYPSTAIYLAGLPESPIESITLEDVWGIGKNGIQMYNLKNIGMKNVNVTSRSKNVDIIQNVTYKEL